MNLRKINSMGKSSGMSVLEVMVAVLVFSVGLIGVAALMLTSMRNNDATLARTQSTVLANEMYEKILANLPGAFDGHYTIANINTLKSQGAASPACDTAICNTEQLADWDLDLWAKRVDQVLVGSDAAISVDNSVNPMIIQISIVFDELMETAGSTTETFTFRARL